MRKTVTIHAIGDQDRLRRAECRRLSPVERLAGLIRFRDQALPHEPLKRVASIRALDHAHLR